MHVAALAKKPSWVFRSAPVINAVELVAAAATFVVGRVKSNLALARVADVPKDSKRPWTLKLASTVGRRKTIACDGGNVLATRCRNMVEVAMC